MMNLSMNWRDKRIFMTSPHFSTANYSTDTKKDMKTVYGEELFGNNLYLSPDCLRKNLADTIITTEKMASKTKNSKNKLEKDKEIKVEEDTHIEGDYSRLAGITNFFSGVLNVISNAMFSGKRKPADFSSDPHQEMALPSVWQGAKILDENKILQDDNLSDVPSDFLTSEMSDCRSAAAHCQSKLDHVRVLLGTTKPPCPLRVRRRPKKVFVEPSSVEDCFEDAFSPEDFENLANDPYYEFSSPICYQEQLFHEIDGPQVKIEAAVVSKETLETSDVVAEHPKVANEDTAVPKVFSGSPGIDSGSPKLVETPPQELETVEMVCEPPNIITEASESPPSTPKVNEELSKTSKDSLVCETTEIVKNVPELDNKLNLEHRTSRTELVESCEDKITKLKLLLQGRRKKTPIIETKTEEPKIVETEENFVTLPESEPKPEPLVTLPPRPQPSNKVKDKRFKNPNRCSSKRRKCRMRKNIQDDALFANEINTEDLSSSVENSPSMLCLENFIPKQLNTTENNKKVETKPQPIPQKDYFNEVTGCFQSASVDSEDSFQIVFTDSPRVRYSSDCDSEDSFIIFEESPDSCYTSNDVFGDSSDSEDYDSDSDMSDSGCGTFKLSASLSKSVSNLADDSLYDDNDNENSGDEVDCANVTVCDCVTVSDLGDSSDSKGLLLNERKKLLRKGLPAKRVHFSPNPPKVHLMHVWLYSARQTRLRYWEKFAVDRERFKNKISNVDMAISWVLKPQHRSRIMFQRFMPWWHAQRRKEIAEKKEREAAEKLKEEERLKNEKNERQNAELNEEVELTEESKEDTEDNELGKNDSSKNSDCTVNSKEQDGSNSLNTSVQGEERDDNDTLVIKEINCQNTTEGTEKSKNFEIENTKNINKSLDETYSDKIVPLNNKIIELNSEHVSGISNT